MVFEFCAGLGGFVCFWIVLRGLGVLQYLNFWVCVFMIVFGVLR